MTGAAVRLLLAALLAALPVALQAQTFTVNAITASAPNFQIVAAAGSGGPTVFRMNASTAAVTKISGGGAVVKGTATRATITIRCSGAACNGATATVTIQPTGSPTARVGAVTGFDLVNGTGTVVTESTSAGVLTATVTGWTSSNTNRTVILAMDIPVQDDTVSTATTGTSQYLVTVNPGAGTGTGTATITVRRQISVAKVSDLAFGAVRRPNASSGSVTISQTTGARSTGGTSPPALVAGLTSGRAVFNVAGTPSTTFAVTTTPAATLNLTSGANTVTTTLVRSVTSGTLNATGALTIGVGGVLTVSSTTPSGDYSGVFTLTVAYN